MKHAIVYISIIELMLSLTLQAQNNPFKIDDELYSDYVRCNKVIKEEKVLAMADSLFRRAKQKGDTKAQCLAWHVRCDHYYYILDIPSLQEAIRDARKFIEKTPYKQYIFSTWLRLIGYYEQRRYYGKALTELQSFQQTAIRMDNSYGISMSYKHAANIYIQQDNYAKGLELYKKALEYSVSRNEAKELHGIYLTMGVIYKNLSLPDSALIYYQKALDSASDDSKKMVVYIQLANAALRVRHIDTAYAYLRKTEELRGKYPLYGSNADMHLTNMVDYYRAVKDYAKAVSYSDSIEIRTTKFKRKELIFSDMKNYQQAYHWFKRYIALRDSTRTEETNHLLADLTSRFDNERLNAEKDRLELRTSHLELEKEKNQRQLLEVEQERNQLQIKNQELTLHQQQNALEESRKEMHYQEERAKIMEARSRQNLITSVILGILLVTVFTLAITYTIFRRRSFKRLKRQKNIAEQARREAENANRLKSLFLQNMSHEIRTPLNAIVGFTGVLNSGEDVELTDEERKEMLGLINTNTELLTTLINDILDLSKLESNTYILNLAPVGISDLCHSVISSMAHRVLSGVELRLEEPDTTCTVTLDTDAARLQQVLNNFLTNACKYTEKGSITLAYRMLDNAIEFSVTDTGSGIPADKAETIFERFEKLDSFKQGTGLGLNICRRIADLVGGRVYVDTSYTDGARFVFVHPVISIDYKKENQNNE
ncbi:ATP-binding protein [Phocaeicola sp.]